MTTEYIKTPSTEAEWLKVRTRGIGGSDIAAIIGLSPWRSPVSVFFDKRPDCAPDGYAEALAAKKEGNLALALGHELEEFTARQYVAETGRNVRRYNYMILSGHCIGDVDRLAFCADGGLPSFHEEVRTDLGIECKTSNQFKWDELPDYYAAQVYHYMGLLPTVQAFDIPTLFKSSSTFHVYHCERDEEAIGALREAAEAFWSRHIATGLPPPPRSEDDCKVLWARSRDKAVTATPELVDAVNHLREVEDAIKGLENEASEAKASIVCAMEDADTLVDSFGRKIASYKSNKDSTKTDWKGLASFVFKDVNLPEGYPARVQEQFTTTKPGARVFRLASVKDK